MKYISRLMMDLKCGKFSQIYQRLFIKYDMKDYFSSLNGFYGNLVKLLCDFRKQGVILNGKNSSLQNVNAEVPQVSILGPLFFQKHINDLSNGMSSNCKLFAYSTSFFSVINDIESSATTLLNDLTVISNCDFQWKIIFNPDWPKRA